MSVGEKRADWSSVYRSKRPRDILDLTEEHEITLRQFFGLTGRDHEGNLSQIFILKYGGVIDPVLTDYPNLPVSTMVICPKLSTPKIFIRKIKSTPMNINDWYVFEFSAIEAGELPDGLFYTSENKVFVTSDGKYFIPLN